MKIDLTFLVYEDPYCNDSLATVTLNHDDELHTSKVIISGIDMNIVLEIERIRHKV